MSEIIRFIAKNGKTVEIRSVSNALTGTRSRLSSLASVSKAVDNVPTKDHTTTVVSSVRPKHCPG